MNTAKKNITPKNFGPIYMRFQTIIQLGELRKIKLKNQMMQLLLIKKKKKEIASEFNNYVTEIGIKNANGIKRTQNTYRYSK